MKRYLNFTNGEQLELENIFAVASNYSKHADEMKTSVPEKPVIFLKPTSAYVPSGSRLFLPEISNEIHHEVELVVVIGKDGKDIRPDEAADYIAGYAVGIDLTLRDLQSEAKKKGQPWGIAKGFFGSAPISDVIPSVIFQGKIPEFDLILKVNGIVRQSSNTRNMVHSVAELVSFISQIFSVNCGDCIFTGTPEGVGKVERGDSLEAELLGFTKLIVYT